MDCCSSTKPYSEGLQPEGHTCKKRKVVQKTVVTMKINEETIGKSKNGGPPSDLWSWRKYGQKPIKGSPHPRGYYKCSTSKGCSAKKQVERSKTDASLLVITYTCDHNHPGPSINDIHPNNSSQETKEPPPPTSLSSIGEEQKLKKEDQDFYFKANGVNGNEEQFQYISSSSPLSCSLSNNHEEYPLITCLENTHKEDPFCLHLLDEEPISYSHLVNFETTPTSEENDFFNELEELLPMSSSYSSTLTSFTGSSFSKVGIPVVPSWSQ